MRIKGTVLSGVLLMALAVPASATTIDFSFATSGMPLFGVPVTGTGVFDLSNTSSIIDGYTAYQIISITGTVDGSAIEAPTGDYGAYYTTGPSFLDGSGANFVTAAGTSVSFFYEGAVSEYRVNTLGPFNSSFVTASATPVATAVPEPFTLSLFGAGLAGVAACRRRRKTAKQL